MKKLVAKYLLEFLVIVIGISISFYIEKENEKTYRDNLKNQSLKRILENIADDNRDFKFNKEALRRAIRSTNWIIDRKRKLKMYSRDSIGFHLNRAVYYNTIFVDNQEEYRGLQNSGLMEMIENENLVSTIQGKYVSHEFFKKIESTIMEKAKYLNEFSFNNLKYKSDSLDDLGLPFDRMFVGTKGIPDNIIEVLHDKKFFQSYYLSGIQRRMKNDQELIDIIKGEINLK